VIDMSTTPDIALSIDKSDGYIVPDGVRTALERLASAIHAEQSDSAEVVGLSFAQQPLLIGSNLPAGLGRPTALKFCLGIRNEHTGDCVGLFYDDTKMAPGT
jgi:hypothetical protein